MVTRTPGPFDYFSDLHAGVTGDTIREAAEQPRKHATALQSLGDELGADERRIGGEIEGDIVHGTQRNARTVKKGSHSLAALGAYAAAVLDKWAAKVDHFDTTVNGINLDYKTRRDNARGPDPESASETYAALLPRWKTASGTLDDDASDIATQFHQGPTDENVRELVRAGLMPLESSVLFPTLHLTKDDVRQSLKNMPPQLGTPSQELKTRLDLARKVGLQPREYATLLRTYWQARSLEAAGINWEDWDIKKGAGALTDIITKVYEYYGKLYKDDPRLQWAGLANLVGPSFAGGFLDLGSIRELAQKVQGGLDKLPPGTPLPFPLDGDTMSQLAGMSGKEVSWYEQKFLSMQQQIFLDMGSMNQAYAEGGMPAIKEMAAAGLFEMPSNPSATSQMLDSWHKIDGADPNDPADRQTLHEAAYTMAYREQHDIIQDDYDQMRNRPVTGELVTKAFSTFGQVSVPGSQTMGEYDPTSVSVTVPGRAGPLGPFGIGPGVDVTGTVTFPVPQGNVADFNDRWDYFTHDTMPAYTDLLDKPQDQPKTIDEIMDEPMDQRIDDYRIYNRVDDLAEVFVDGTKVDVDADWKWW